MKRKSLQFRTLGLASLSAVFTMLSISSMAQKGVYDVVPGSGPKQPKPAEKSVYDVVPGSGPKKTQPAVIIDQRTNHPVYRNERVYRDHKIRRRHLPPGQAKKIYGGSATDYAPGQVKKRSGYYEDGHWKSHGHKKRSHHKKAGKH